MKRALRTLARHERINFLLTNRIPRHAVTRTVGWISRLENRWLAAILIWIWRVFSPDLDLSEAEETKFRSMQDCFTRRLKPGARAVDGSPDIVASPCDAIVGECGEIAGTTVYQAKGFPYELGELIPEAGLRETFRNGRYVTLRLRSSMYHRFHAPVACTAREITYVSGDTWNVNPIALKRVEKLFCRNERAVLRLDDLATTGSLCLVPVAAILVASMRFSGLDSELNLKYRGPNRIPWSRRFAKGEEMGCFLQGSTILLFATANYALADGIRPGETIRMGQGLMVDLAPARAQDTGSLEPDLEPAGAFT